MGLTHPVSVKFDHMIRLNQFNHISNYSLWYHGHFGLITIIPDPSIGGTADNKILKRPKKNRWQLRVFTCPVIKLMFLRASILPIAYFPISENSATTPIVLCSTLCTCQYHQSWYPGPWVARSTVTRSCMYGKYVLSSTRKDWRTTCAITAKIQKIIYYVIFHEIYQTLSTFPIVIIFCGGRVSEMFVTSYSVTYCIYIPGKLRFCSHHHCAVYDECKRLDTLWPADRIRLFVHYTISLSSLCTLICRHWTYEMSAKYILSSVWVKLNKFS